MLSPSSYPVRPIHLLHYICRSPNLIRLYTVGEDEEVSIKEVADAIVKAVGFEGDYSVRDGSYGPFANWVALTCYFSSTPVAPMVNSGNLRPTRSLSRS